MNILQPAAIQLQDRLYGNIKQQLLHMNMHSVSYLFSDTMYTWILL